MAANPWRGEVGIILDGQAYIMCPTFKALSAIEQELSTGLIALARKMTDGTITLEELAVIVKQCLSDGTPPLDSIRKALVRSGVTAAMESVAAMLTMVFGGLDAPGA